MKIILFSVTLVGTSTSKNYWKFDNDSLIFLYFDGLGDFVADYVINNTQFVGPSVSTVYLKTSIWY